MKQLISPNMDPEQPGAYISVPPPGTSDLTSLKAIELDPNEVALPDNPSIDEEMRGAVLNELA